MGRKPNPIVSDHFTRGEKLNDNSNRYPQTCKHCGEHFHRGRPESLMIHITKKCPAISDADRLHACIMQSGIQDKAGFQARAASPQANGAAAAAAAAAALRIHGQNWSALETLAEASRQVDMSEKGGKRGAPNGSASNPASATNGAPHSDGPDASTIEDLTAGVDVLPDTSKDDANIAVSPEADQEALDLATTEARLQALIQEHTALPDTAALSVAAAATARLNPSLLDPQLSTAEPATAAPTLAPAAGQLSIEGIGTIGDTPRPEASKPDGQTAGGARSWEPIAYRGPTNYTAGSPHPVLRRGGARIDPSDPTDGKPKHQRARFDPLRRKEVQEVRRIGACSRCRILRKTCDNNTPCSTCEKVINPRVWNAGCIRDRLVDHVDLWSAGLQVVLTSSRNKHLQETWTMTTSNDMVQATHFYELSINVTAPIMVGFPTNPTPDPVTGNVSRDWQITMIPVDNDKIDLSQSVEAYMRQALPNFIQQEPSRFMNVTLKTAKSIFDESKNKLLGMALDLWGLTEIIDREEQWNIVKAGDVVDGSPNWLERPPYGGTSVYSHLAGQLSAAAERRANMTSENLLKLMHRDLHDSKTKIGVPMYFTALILLNAIEKYTWLFYAYDQEVVRRGWPLTDKEPKTIYQKVTRVADHLKTLLSMRKILPLTEKGLDGKVNLVEGHSTIGQYLTEIGLEWDSVLQKQRTAPFSGSDTRSLELFFCSHLLLSDMPSPSPQSRSHSQ